MALAIINIISKQHFNFMCRTDFERKIFHLSYAEFQKKSKKFTLNNTLSTFSAMKEANAKANVLHHDLNYAVMGVIENLHKQNPILFDTDLKPTYFDFAELLLADSSLTNKAAHYVEINYTSPDLILLDTFGDFLLLQYREKKYRKNSEATFMLKSTPGLFIQKQVVSKQLMLS